MAHQLKHDDSILLSDNEHIPALWHAGVQGDQAVFFFLPFTLLRPNKSLRLQAVHDSLGSQNVVTTVSNSRTWEEKLCHFQWHIYALL